MRRWLACLPICLDVWWRLRDFKVHRSHGGLAERWLRLEGHSPLALGVACLLLAFLVVGPVFAGHLSASGGALLVAAALLMWLGMRLGGERRALPAQLAVLVLVAVGLWYWPGVAATEAEGGFYRHLLLVLVPAGLVPAVTVAWLLAAWIFRGVPSRSRTLFRDRLETTELFVDPPFTRVRVGDLVRSVVNAPLEHPLLLLYIPAVPLVVLPYQAHLGLWCGAFLAASWFLIALAGVHPRLDAMLVLARRALFTGGQLVVSLLVILLAAARLAGLTYVTTVLESGRWWLLASYLLAAYAFFWFYEYWTNRILGERLLSLLRQPGDPVGRATYRMKLPESRRTRVDPEGRVIQIHGGARLAVVGRPVPGHDGPCFQLYEKLEPFRKLAESEDPDAVADLRARVRCYFAALNLLLAVAGGVAAWGLAHGVQEPLAAVDGAATGSFDLRSELFVRRLAEPGEAQQRAILLAASGGGTRAAMFTEAVLEGLTDLEALPDLVLASGVSGGGASIAYLAGHWPSLRRQPTSGPAWTWFRCTMDDPFIQDVLEGASEWRIASATRLGQLLYESFRRRFADAGATVGGTTDFGLVFNTALAGTLRAEAPVEDCRSFPVWAREHHRFTSSEGEGGRLIFTNLSHREAFPRALGLDPEDVKLHYVVVADPRVELARAAALNANFPPVFSNAAVDSCRTGERHWVTDGGAADNRGVISLLLALRDAVARQKALLEGDQGPVELQGMPPRLEIVVAEASAGDLSYSQDRGVGTKFGAPAEFASQLMKELVFQIRADYAALGGRREDVRLHYLEMPAALRIDGGMGTHWMLPSTVRLGDPATSDPDLRAHPEVDGLAVRDVIYSLFRSGASGAVGATCADDARARPESFALDVETVWSRVCRTPDELAVWSDLAKDLAGPGRAPALLWAGKCSKTLP